MRGRFARAGIRSQMPRPRPSDRLQCRDQLLPGWGDAVEIQPADVAEGLKFAERSFELAGELGLGDKEMGTSL